MTLHPFLRPLYARRGVEGAKRVADTDRVLYVQGVPKDFPCQKAAMLSLHAAQDGGYGTIVVCKPPNHRHEFNVLEMVRWNKRTRPQGSNPWTGTSLAGLTRLVKNDSVWFDTFRKLYRLGPMPRPDAKVSLD